jgi:group I intron endonuclease
MTSGLYQIKNTISGGVYIGRSVDVDNRLTHHRNELRRGVHRNRRLQNSWNKYGLEAFKFQLLWEKSPDELYELEGFVLEFLWGDERLYNHYKLSYGGFEPGNKIGCFPRSEETRERMRQAFIGRVFSDEHRNKIRVLKTGLKASEATRKKMSQAKIGKPRSASFSEKMSVKMTGEANPMFGKISPMRGMKFPTIACEHCGKESSKGNYLRWHGANCRSKNHE